LSDGNRRLLGVCFAEKGPPAMIIQKNTFLQMTQNRNIGEGFDEELILSVSLPGMKSGTFNIIH
jgi:hypothetical protein